MSLLAQAAADSRAILEDAAGFSTPLNFTAPNGDTLALRGIFFDIGLGLDVETGQAVANNTVSIRVSTGRFLEAGLEIPRGISDPKSKPWLVQLTDSLGRARTFKVVEQMSDATLPVLILRVEPYKS